MRTFAVFLICLGLAATPVAVHAVPPTSEVNPDVALLKWTKQDDPKLAKEQQQLISSACNYAIEKWHLKSEIYVNTYFKIKPIKDVYAIYFGNVVNFEGTKQIWKYQKIELNGNGLGINWEIYD